MVSIASSFAPFCPVDAFGPYPCMQPGYGPYHTMASPVPYCCPSPGPNAMPFCPEQLPSPWTPSKKGNKTPSMSTTALSPQRDSNNTNIYISGLPRAITDQAFEALVSKFGQIFSFKVVHKGPQAPPVGFVQYTTAAMAQKAMVGLNGMAFQGAILKAKMALRDKDKGVNSKPSANLYICNLPSSFNTEDLRQVFAKHGKIISLVALTNPATGQSRGTGFVRFSSVKEARLAKEALHGCQLQPGLPLEVKFAESSAERSQRLRSRVEASETRSCQSFLSSPRSPANPATPATAPPQSAGLPKKQRPAPLQTAPSLKSADFPILGLEDECPVAGETADAFGSLIDGMFSGSEEPFIEAMRVQKALFTDPAEWETMNAVTEESLTECSPRLQDDWAAWDRTPCLGSRPPSQLHLWKFSESQEGRQSGQSSPPSPSSGNPATSSTIRVANLPLQTTEVDIYKLCSPYGAIAQVNLNPDPQGKACVAFVQFQASADAGQAQAKLHGTVKDQHPLTVSF